MGAKCWICTTRPDVRGLRRAARSAACIHRGLRRAGRRRASCMGSGLDGQHRQLASLGVRSALRQHQPVLDRERADQMQWRAAVLAVERAPHRLAVDRDLPGSAGSRRPAARSGALRRVTGNTSLPDAATPRTSGPRQGRDARLRCGFQNASKRLAVMKMQAAASRAAMIWPSLSCRRSSRLLARSQAQSCSTTQRIPPRPGPCAAPILRIWS